MGILNIPRMIFSSFGSSVRTGGMSMWSISWSSQIMLSSQRPYTNSSLSMGKMENQGESSSWEAEEQQQKKDNTENEKLAWDKKKVWWTYYLYWDLKNKPWLSWLFFSRLEPEIEEALGMGGGVGGTNWELLRVRPVRLNRLLYFLYTHEILQHAAPTSIVTVHWTILECICICKLCVLPLRLSSFVNTTRV